MAEFATFLQRDCKATGVTCSVPDDDFSRLSYYLFCVSKGVGLDILQDDLVDYKNARFLSKERKDGILTLAYLKLDLEATDGKVIFEDEDGSMCRGSDNEFYELSQVVNRLGVVGSVLLMGQQTEVAKIMVYRPSWIERNYKQPIRNQTSRIQDICSSYLLAAMLESVGVTTKDSNPSQHCDHCMGHDAVCTCTHGCAEGMHSKCHVVHTGIICDGCGCGEEEISGCRFKCKVCQNFDLCESCYNQGARKHDMTHAFIRYDRVGSDPVYLAPRRKPSPISPRSAIQPPVSPSAPAAHLDDSLQPVFEVGEQVIVTGLNNSSHLNGATGVVIQLACGGDGWLRIRLTDREPGTVKSIKAKNLKKQQKFQPGQIVALTGLQAREKNGIEGTVVEACNASGRVLVRLHTGNNCVGIKPENLTLVADVLD